MPWPRSCTLARRLSTIGHRPDLDVPCRSAPCAWGGWYGREVPVCAWGGWYGREAREDGLRAVRVGGSGGPFEFVIGVVGPIWWSDLVVRVGGGPTWPALVAPRP